MTKSSGNVFRDLGFPPEEAENLRVRAQLMVEIEKYVRAKGLTQKAAAKQFGITQPQITNLLVTAHFTAAMLRSLGQQIWPS